MCPKYTLETHVEHDYNWEELQPVHRYHKWSLVKNACGGALIYVKNNLSAKSFKDYNKSIEGIF